MRVILSETEESYTPYLLNNTVAIDASASLRTTGYELIHYIAY